MSDTKTPTRPLSGKERDKYLDCLGTEVARPQRKSFYIARVNQFIAAIDGRDPGTLDEQELGSVFTALDKHAKLKDWQFAELVDAVRVYLVNYLGLGETFAFVKHNEIYAF